MRQKIEQQIIELIRAAKNRSPRLNGLDEKLSNSSFGSSSRDFLNNPIIKSYVEGDSASTSFKYWMLIENYIVNADDEELKKVNFELLTEELHKALSSNENLLYRQCLADSTFIRNVYLSGNKQLIQLFMQLLPIPKAEIFKGYEVPPFIAEQERQTVESILRNPIEEEIIMKVQRLIRGRIRHEEEIERVTKIVREVRTPYFKEMSGKDTVEQIVEQLLNDATIPYRPKGCDPKLADRIVDAAKKVTLFSEIKHATSASALPSILNEGLFGRRTLEQFNMHYAGAALMDCDIKDGDHNVICFGPQEIDPKSIQRDNVEIQLDLKKIQKDNPCIFYKQRDLGYRLEKRRKVLLGEKPLFFSHTNSIRLQDPRCTYFQLFDSLSRYDDVTAYSTLPKFLFIAYDVQNMHQILTLNFFRFLDKLSCSNLIKSIYERIDALSNQALVDFLEDMGKNLTDTAEFNFYGAHKIDFSSIKSFKFNNYMFADYTLELPAFINELQAGNLTNLRTTKNTIPQIFESYRFIDFLTSQVADEAIKSELEMYRKECSLPFWLAAREKGLTDSGDLAAYQEHLMKDGIVKRESATTDEVEHKQPHQRYVFFKSDTESTPDIAVKSIGNVAS